MELRCKFYADTPRDPETGPIYKKWKQRCGKSPAWAYGPSELKLVKNGCASSHVGRAGEDRFIKMGFDNMQIYGVFDGHGGSGVVNAIVEKLPQLLYVAMQKIDLQNQFQIVRCVQEIYTQLDTEILQSLYDDPSGSTATVALVLPTRIYLINLGDSRTVLFNDHKEILLETKDHSPYDFDEFKRIKLLGGCVTRNNGYRVNGILAVSRAFGDYELKRTARSSAYDPMGWVSAMPDIYVYDIPEKSEPLHLLMASDGLWDAFSSKQAIDMVDYSKYTCNGLISEAKKQTTDDITVIIVNI